jgi:hypothetical protein
VLSTLIKRERLFNFYRSPCLSDFLYFPRLGP